MIKTRWLDMVLLSLQVVCMTCLLGIAVDLVTAHIAVEYFTIHHPRVVDSKSPWVMALVWGIGASWWFGLIASIVIWATNARRDHPLSRKRLVRMIPPLLLVVWLVMMLILSGVYLLAGQIPEASRRATFESDRRLMSVAICHMTEYVLGVLALVFLAFQIKRTSESDVST
ncbi:MAG: hypothetical protein ABL949_10780 [Fimbriimonadaceae bacterium]